MSRPVETQKYEFSAEYVVALEKYTDLIELRLKVSEAWYTRLSKKCKKLTHVVCGEDWIEDPRFTLGCNIPEVTIDIAIEELSK